MEKFYLVQHLEGKGDTFLSYQDNQYGSHWAWNMDNVVYYDSKEKAEKVANYHYGNIEVRQAKLPID